MNLEKISRVITLATELITRAEHVPRLERRTSMELTRALADLRRPG